MLSVQCEVLSRVSRVLIFQLPSYSAYYSCTTTSPILIFPLPTDSAYGVGATTHSPVLVFQLPRYSAYSSCTTKSPVSSSSCPDTPHAIVVLPSRQFSSSSSPDTPRTTVVLRRRQLSSSSSPDTPRTTVVLPTKSLVLIFQLPKYSAYYSFTTKSPVLIFQLPSLLQLHYKVASSHLPAPQIRARGTSRPLACFSRTRPAQSQQRVARAWGKSHSRLHFAHSTRTISAEGCAHGTHRTLACISLTRHARSPQRVARMGHIALLPAFGALDTHDLRRGLHFRLTLFVPPSAFKENF